MGWQWSVQRGCCSARIAAFMPLARFESLKPVLIAAADISILALMIYWLLTIVRGTRAAHVLAGVVAVAVTYRLAAAVGLVGLQSFLGYIAPFTAIALVVLFQSEIRRSLTQLGRREFFSEGRRDESLEDILLALKALSHTRTGALITVENNVGLRTFIESGVRMDSQVSSALLVSIFQRTSPLHDGAVIIQKGAIAAAACFLPLTTRPVSGVNVGSRHRAAIGITEDTDCVSIVVSEHSGEISIATDGMLQPGLTVDQVRERVALHLIATRGRKESRAPL